MGVVWPERTRKRAVAMMRRNPALTVKEAAEAVGVAWRTVRAWASEAGLTRTGRPSTYSIKTLKQANAAKRRGMSWPQVAEAVGASSGASIQGAVRYATKKGLLGKKKKA